ncbi:LytR C-terminal domain-containing protein [Actinoplanes oblitus]|uniref:LytR C-terminal domain-containing protein n=1 Tax=Actinoplanes oblitus TaxID=3040509 RepID=A0ABY8WTU5_9ACTN|nr:LytR C-terminal domain-containing protein [Actinoplanes oblitus]WIN00243.1 LytR C-terminal domain-containing protein [Actinoplanes oblitus]
MTDTRVRAYRILSALAGLAAVSAVVAVVHDTQGVAVASESCSVQVNLRFPDRPAQVRLRVFNGTRTTGLAERVSQDFKNRGFAMQSPGKSKTRVDEVAVIEYGPKSVGAAQWIRAFFLGQAEPRFSASRTTDVVDVKIGTRYRQLATQTEVNQSLAQLGEPAPPPGTCA